MRILLVNPSICKLGGAEDYLEKLIPGLRARGHALALAYETEAAGNRPKIKLPNDAPTWNLADIGLEATLAGIRHWEPDVVYAHGQLDFEFEVGFLGTAPAVYFEHNYYGTCISGLKTFRFPIVQPCTRRFGKACLLSYFPRHCGGRNPITMWKLFHREAKRLTSLSKYKAIVTHSHHMRDELLRHGFSKTDVYNFVDAIDTSSGIDLATANIANSQLANRDANSGHQWQLAFVGRMEVLKGGAVLLDALRLVLPTLNRPLRLVIAGDGPARDDWEQLAFAIRTKHPALDFEFPGWLDENGLVSLYTKSDLLVIPSLWPEPFGRIGPEAGSYGVPAAGFGIGGISDWLRDGINGFLAPGDPPTAHGLANAIVKCLQDPTTYQDLRKGAVRMARQFEMDRHLDALERIFEKVTGEMLPAQKHLAQGAFPRAIHPGVDER
jgi:glycosyltransferase involved in cell wall biosynthesis